MLVLQLEQWTNADQLPVCALHAGRHLLQASTSANADALATGNSEAFAKAIAGGPLALPATVDHRLMLRADVCARRIGKHKHVSCSLHQSIVRQRPKAAVSCIQCYVAVPAKHAMSRQTLQWQPPSIHMGACGMHSWWRCSVVNGFSSGRSICIWQQ